MDKLSHEYLSLIDLSYDSKQNRLFEMKVVELLVKECKYNSSHNDSSIVLQLDYMETKYLFMGDSTFKVENAIKHLENVDVLKVGHHASNGSTSEEFLRKNKS